MVLWAAAGEQEGSEFTTNRKIYISIVCARPHLVKPCARSPLFRLSGGDYLLVLSSSKWMSVVDSLFSCLQKIHSLLHSGCLFVCPPDKWVYESIHPLRRDAGPDPWIDG